MTDPFYSVASPPDFDKPVRVLIAVSCHDRHVAGVMVQAAQAVLHAHPIDVDVIEVERVDELPSALALSARMSQFDGFMALCPLSLDSEALGQVRDVLSLWSMQGNLTGAAILSETSNTSDVEASNAANALLHLIALGRKWGAQRKGIGFRPHSDEHN